MRYFLTIISVLSIVVGSSGPAGAAGCIKGALAGGVAGHYAGGHAYVGALGGCLVGRRLAVQRATRARDAAAQNQAMHTGPVIQPQPSTNSYTGGGYMRGPSSAGTSGLASPQYAPSNVPSYTGGAYQR